MARIKYQDGKPIQPRLTQTWLITFPDKGERRLLVVAESFTTEGVVRVVEMRNPGREFTVQNIDVGEFVLSQVLNSYSGDARKVDQDLYFAGTTEGLHGNN